MLQKFKRFAEGAFGCFSRKNDTRLEELVDFKFTSSRTTTTGMQQGQTHLSPCPLRLDLAKAFDRLTNKETGFFWVRPNLCRLVQELPARMNNSDHGGSCRLVTLVHVHFYSGVSQGSVYVLCPIPFILYMSV